MHTLHSYLVTDKEDNLYALGGTPGAFRQPQTNLQILDGLIRLQKNPQDALDDPRWGIDPEKGLFVESRTPNILGEKLQFEGSPAHYLESWDGWTGRASVARIYPNWLEVGCDLRGEGQAIVD
jgi:gamma-glutamyltranspeptidase